MKKTLFLIVFSGIITASKAQITLPRIFGDKMMFQRDIEIPVWGNAPAGETITLVLNGTSSQTTADAQGKWSVHLPKQNAGGPYQLEIKSNKHPKYQLKIKDILIGDLWFASGQSNMELKVQEAQQAQQEIRNANYPAIRYFNVPHGKSPYIQNDLNAGNWTSCDSTSVKTMSAVAYFFARKIHTDQKVPVGIIQSTWGGTPVEAWTSREMLLSSAITREKILANDSVKIIHYEQDSLNLIRFWDIVYHPQNKTEKTVAQEKFNDNNWDEITMPSVIKNWKMNPYEGIIWLRKTIELDTTFCNRDITLELGHPEMNYSVYINGQKICTTVWNASPTHHYVLPMHLLKKGKNVLAVRMAVLWGGGGFNPPAEEMYLSNGKDKISISGKWKYKADLEPRVPKIQNYQNYPNFVFNAMIHPVAGYGIKGFLWYQGEANDSLAYDYRTLFPMMITDWRTRWKQGYLPFIFVQLPNYRKYKEETTGSEWAELREAQEMTLSQPRTGMVCTIDLGEATDIHPKNKQEVGRRMAMVAENMVYHSQQTATGPSIKSFQSAGGYISLSFDQDNLTTSDQQAPRGFTVAGSDGKFYPAKAEIKGNVVKVSAEKVTHPVAVRYAWADNPDCNLINSEGLPAHPFRTDQWPGVTQKRKE